MDKVANDRKEPRGAEYNLSTEFRELCMACRKGDLELVDTYIASGIDLNQMDEWDYSPLILASICGHEDVVKLLLEKGCLVSRDTFEGSRAIYGALTDSIRTLLLTYDISKAVDVTQPFASHISAMLLKPKFITSDMLLRLPGGDSISVHKFMLIAMSDFFKGSIEDLVCKSGLMNLLTTTISNEGDDSSWRFIVDYIYLVPKLELESVDIENLVSLARLVGLPDLATASQRIMKQKTITEQLRVKNEVQRQMCEIARGKMKKFVCSEVIEKKLLIDKEQDTDDRLYALDAISGEQKKSLVKDNGADIILCADIGDKYAYYPAHRAILAKSEYFDTLFQSSFAEMSVFGNCTLDDLGIIDLQSLLDDPDSIPVVSLPISAFNDNEKLLDISQRNLHLIEILLCFLYCDYAEIPPDMAIDMIILADSLFIERLKTLAAITITRLKKDYDEAANISLYDIIRVAWQTRMQRLETEVAIIFSMDLPKYVSDPEFEKIVLESAERIQYREDYDTIELIADIKFYLRKKYSIDDDEGTLDPDPKGDIEDENLLERDHLYREDLASLDNLVVKLGL
ncbi:hypothetical protein FOA43_004758 [Brettanomyces nanus]|uniref:BTB domain-containing protein n=1 Tax=Eeniella nana TaxID=13502 RepID=A0A875RYJ6_EENNA|nr:uncharacterized protein FOA43_004758 [Brettanomyces nanus]QPG77347.1 hypothetical protein FOA43_004758 [Brettanomyces nanus]